MGKAQGTLSYTSAEKEVSQAENFSEGMPLTGIAEQQGRIIYEKITNHSLEENVPGNSITKELTIYLSQTKHLPTYA